MGFKLMTSAILVQRSTTIELHESSQLGAGHIVFVDSEKECYPGQREAHCEQW